LARNRTLDALAEPWRERRCMENLIFTNLTSRGKHLYEQLYCASASTRSCPSVC
jgi:hypothetical protein